MNEFDQTPHPSDVDERYHVFNQGNIFNVLYWASLFSLIRDLEFDSIVECGVGRGRSLLTICAINRFLTLSGGWKSKEVYALDSFDGFPNPTEEDRSFRNPKKGEWSHSPTGTYKYSPEFLRNVFKSGGMGDLLPELKVVPGFFDVTVPNLDVSPIGILHLDADLYLSTKIPLDALAPRLVVGGIVVIDDFEFDFSGSTSYDEAWPGARRAVTEFIQSHNCFSMHRSVRGTPYLKRDF